MYFKTSLIPTVTGGENLISRKSSESSVTVPDIPSFSKLIHDADAAVANGAELHNEQFAHQCGIPNRMLLPKGTHEGMEFALVVTVSDATEDEGHETLEKSGHHSHGQCGITGEKQPDHQPMGFPLDRKIADDAFLHADNIKSILVKVHHHDNHHDDDHHDNDSDDH